MIIETSRFGQVSIEDSDIVQFPEGLFGFTELRKFVFLDDPTDEIFVWLQSCEAPGVAFPVLEPQMFMDAYEIRLAKTDLDFLKASSAKDVKTFCIVTIPDEPTQMTANLKAPLAVAVGPRIGRQCVLQENHYAIREPIFLKLQQRIVPNAEGTSNLRSSEKGEAPAPAPTTDNVIDMAARIGNTQAPQKRPKKFIEGSGAPILPLKLDL